MHKHSARPDTCKRCLSNYIDTVSLLHPLPHTSLYTLPPSLLTSSSASPPCFLYLPQPPSTQSPCTHPPLRPFACCPHPAPSASASATTCSRAGRVV